MKRAQSAMEFLMTYGWAILVIIIVIAVLFYMGVMNPKNMQTDTCVLAPGFSCYTFRVAGPNATLYLDFGQATGGGVIVDGIGCSENPLPEITPLTNPVYVGSGEHSVVAAGDSGNSVHCTDAGGNEIFSQGSTGGAVGLFQGTLAINYTSLSDNSTHTIFGDIRAGIESGDFHIDGMGCAPNCGIGSGCTLDSQCASGYCFGGTCQICTSNCPIGLSCTDRSMCASDFCDMIDGVCATNPPCPPRCGDGLCSGDENLCNCDADCDVGPCNCGVLPCTGLGGCDYHISSGCDPLVPQANSHEHCPAQCPLNCSGENER